LTGRPDYIDQGDAAVIDYKTGEIDQARDASEAERRQLKLYAFLATENGIDIRKAAVIRADGTRIEFALKADEAADEARRALQLLEAYNALAGRPFAEAASPSSQNCRFCPCIVSGARLPRSALRVRWA
jgi:RecB family exonuclease